MKGLKYLLVGIVLAGLLATVLGCQDLRYVTVKTGGDLYQSAAGGRLQVTGTLTYCSVAGKSGTAIPYDVKFVADALSVETGARYALYGYSTDAVTGLPMRYLAYDGRGQIAFEGMLTVDPAVPDGRNLVAAITPFSTGTDAGRARPGQLAASIARHP